jgi:ABC-type multidrug transport system ATPase subunit
MGELEKQGIVRYQMLYNMDEAQHCDRVVMINEGKIVVSGPPSRIVQDMFPDRTDADLNDVFIQLMTRNRS